MRAIAACLLLAFVLLPLAQAREVRLSAADACPDKATKAVTRAKAAQQTPAVRETRVRPSEHGDADTGSRLNASPRWHSFLPGMIR